MMSARDERIRVFGGPEGALPPGVFSSSLRDLVLSADTRGGFSPRARDFSNERGFVLGDYLLGALGWLAERG